MKNSRGINRYNYLKEKPKTIERPNSASGNNLGRKTSFTSQKKSFNNENDYNIYKYDEEKNSMFNQYYKDKLKNKNDNLNQFENEQIKVNYQRNINNDNNINNNNEEEEKIKNKNIQRPLTAKNKISHQKDFLADSKYIISCIQNANNNNNKLKKNNSKEKAFHKEYGKTPKYLQNMKLEAEKKKEIEKLRKETSKYPKGTRLLSEEERLFTLEKLKQSKNDINQIIEKLPITCDSQAFRNKKEELFKKLDEIENAIETFSKKKVFVKVEDS